MAKLLNSLFLYGDNGTRKTTMVAMAGFHNGLWVTTRKPNLGYYQTIVEHQPDTVKKYGLTPIDFDKRVVEIRNVDFNSKTKKIEKVGVRDKIDAVVARYVELCLNGEMKDSFGIVFDDFTSMLPWVFEDFTKEAGRDTFKAQREFQTWLKGLAFLSDITGQRVAFTGHKSEPKYHEEGPKQGELKYTGGPSMPLGSAIGDICSLMDAVIASELVASGFGNDKKFELRLRTKRTDKFEGKLRLEGFEMYIPADLRPLYAKDGAYTL